MKGKETNAGEVSPLMKELSAYIAGALKRPLPEEVVEKTKHHVLDTIAAMVSGSRLLPGKKAIAYVKTLGGAKEACVIGSRFVTTAEHAALANGMLAHADETDDSHAPSLSHPGCAIVPAALAMAERERRNGTAFLRAVALGYDVGTRINMALHAYDFRDAGHSTPQLRADVRRGRCRRRARGSERRRRRAGCSPTPRSRLRRLVLDARRGAHREGVRLRRHAGAQRRRRRRDGRRGLHRGRRRVLGRAQFLHRLRRDAPHRAGARAAAPGAGTRHRPTRS